MILGGLIGLIIVLAIAGFIVWLVVTYIPMPDIFQKVIIVVVVIVLLLYVLQLFNITPSMRLR